MSDFPPTIDAILESIRARVTGEAENPPPPRPVEFLPDPVVPIAELGAVEVPSTGVTLESMMQKMLEPMLKAWLDAHLPEIAEKAAQDEIKRLSGRG